MKKLIYLSIIIISFNFSFAQDYFLENFGPYNENIQSPEEFLGYEIGDQHTRHDLILAYFKYLSSVSERANLINYGKSYEGRTLTLLSISNEENLKNLEEIKTEHLKSTIPGSIKTINENLPIIINLGYGIHGNEPSASEAALLTAYTLIASKNKKIDRLTTNSVVFIDPTLNPDGRDRHSQWANQYKSINLVADSNDAEHNESWPRGRTNHYWFDLNRDWLLAVHPESRGKLNWLHEWYPNVVIDVHEMGTNSNYFFDPMKSSASVKPLIPQENVDLYPIFAEYYVKYMDSIGSFYYTKESFDETYPGYGSTYSDLQGGLALLFEQASSRGHVQETNYGEMTFGFTIRNQFLNGIATVEAAVDNKMLLRDYQKRFFESSLSEFKNEKIKAYEFGDIHDKNRTKAFIDKLLIHKIEVYEKDDKFLVPVNQLQSRMVKNFFETNDKYLDSVFYDASAWSVSNFYNMKHKAVRSFDVNKLTRVINDMQVDNPKVSKSNYAYILDWDDYNTPAALNHLHKNEVISYSAYKPFSIKVNENDNVKSFNRGTVMVPVSKQKVDSEKLFEVVKSTQEKFNIPVFSTETGYSSSGIDLGSNFFRINKKVKVAMLIGDGVSSYEAGEVWHLLDTRVHIPLTKIRLNQFNRISLDKYTTLVMVSGTYNQISDSGIKKIKDWVGRGNTLITIGSASGWAIKKEIVNESLVETKNDTIFSRKRYIDAREYSGRERIGGSILKVDLDLTHPLAFGYRDQSIPVYKNNNVFLNKSKSDYSSVAIYSKNPHIDGYVCKKNKENNLKVAASLIVSDSGSGRVVLFADNPNFRGSWYGTNKLFLNAIFFGANISVPK